MSFSERLSLKRCPETGQSFTSQSVFQSLADRDGMLQSGMEHGVNDSYERLDELLARGSTAKTVSR